MNTRTPLQTAFTIEPTKVSLLEQHTAELEAKDAVIAELSAEMQQLRDDLALARLRLEGLPDPEPLGRYETAGEIELRLADYFDSRTNIIVPNVSWGLFDYEMDLCVLKPNGEVIEVEIKVSLSDLRADKKKRHGHRNASVSRLYFAVAEKVSKSAVLSDFPERAGILVVDPKGNVDKVREAKKDDGAFKFSDKKRATLARLGTIRMWNLKHSIVEIERERKRFWGGKERLKNDVWRLASELRRLSKEIQANLTEDRAASLRKAADACYTAYGKCYVEDVKPTEDQ